MDMIKESDLKVLFSEDSIQKAVKALGDKLNIEYGDDELYMICVLKGSVMFMVDLSKYLKMPLKMEFIRLSSYGSAFVSTGKVSAVDISLPDLNGKNVLVIEDIVDSGRTLSYLLEMLRDRGPKSLALCTLLDKPSRRVVAVDVNYTGFQIPDEFVVGYGLDYAEKYRNLPFVGVLKPEVYSK